MYLDPNGLIEQQDGDGGDKLQREGFWYEGHAYNHTFPNPSGMASYDDALAFLTDSNGNLLRDEIKWTDPLDVSRDQLVPNVRCCGIYRFKDRLNRILGNVIRNFSRYPNGDIALFTDYARFIRAYDNIIFYPLLLILDVQLLLSSIFRVLLSYPDKYGWFWKANSYVGDDLNHIGDLAQAKYWLGTPLGFLSRKIFKLRAGGAMYGMRIYFDASTGANTEFIDLWNPIVEDF